MSKKDIQVAFFCNGKDPNCNKHNCYILNGDCDHTTNPKYRLSPIIVDDVELVTRLEQLDDRHFFEVVDNSLYSNQRRKRLNEVPHV